MVRGWNNYPSRRVKVFRPERIEDLSYMMNQRKDTILARGGGTTYGDSSINNSGINIDTKRFNKMLRFDAEKDLLHCQSGVSLQDISKVFIPRGWFLNVTPGTKYATIGGCIATDAHGKNWKAGSFGNYVKGFHLMLSDGRIVYCDSNTHSDIFYTTIGGMGMTGVILDAYVQLRKITSSLINIETIQYKNLRECFDAMDESMESYEYVFCWLDSHQEGARMGRGLLQRATHMSNYELEFKEKRKVSIPFYLPEKAVNSFFVKTFNQCYYSSVRTKQLKTVHMMDYFYPLDGIGKWYRIYGRRGFVEYQVVIPFNGAYEAIYELLKIITKSKLGSVVSAIKPLRDTRGMMSFPMDGVTLAVDFMIHDRLWKLLDTLDEIVVAHNGRVYLAKDARLRPENFRKMYSKSFDAWDVIRARYDHGDGLSSMMFSRLRNIQPAMP